ncbi:hybrid sensor histidine kinase/response regulator [Paludisphaera mucosa]|uniref:histidine kinase n=1 Tax=Paludisphaera mucosa TaxID=3030827 RepID=A0ABT6FCZ2_9BACT|nr:PAS domain S-box protein [Paludisphaera mucosa]MDG3005452.1 PAS domain S-box protein [Paludisphaera mucosa]
MRALVGGAQQDPAGPAVAPEPTAGAGRERGPVDENGMAEIRYRALVEQIPAVTFMSRLDRGMQELYVSPQIEIMLGFSQKEWLENPILWYQQLHPDDRDRWQSEFARTIVGGVPFRAEYRFLAKSGRVIWVRGEAQIIRDAGGAPLFLQGIAFDITDQKEAEAILHRSREQLEGVVRERTSELGEANRALQAEIAERTRTELALRDREARLGSIVESAVDGILVIDHRGVVESFNPAAQRIFGYSSDEVLGRNIKMLMPAPYREEHDGYLANYLETGIPKIIGIGRDVTGRRKDGGTFPMELAVSKTPTSDGIKFTGIVRDVTQRKRDESDLTEAKLAAESASKLKSEFLANMSHEIRTPMNGIIGMTELALDTDLDPIQREYLGAVKISADALLTLINDILDFSKIEAGKLDLDATDFDVREMVGEALKPMAVRASEKGLELACEIEADVPDVLVGDPGRLRQIMINLVGNAIKFTMEGEVVVKVGREAGSGDADLSLHISITDTGIGVPEDKQQRIFESFTQADGSTTRKFGGTGLGLAISRRLVELMGGRIWLESRPGVGTTFHFTAKLPRCLVASHAAADASADFRGMRTLIIDDNATNRTILERVVIGWGMTPTLCDSGLTGLEAMSRAVDEGRPYSLVLLDAMMPEVDGFEVIRRINADPYVVGATILMLSSAAQLYDAVSYREMGLSRFLIKPVRPSDLLAAIRQGLGGRSVPRHDPSTPDTTPGPSANEPLRILLADDNAVNQRLGARLLEKQGHAVVVAGDGRQTLELLAGGHFDMVLMDIQMPVMNGFEAAAAIRSREVLYGGHIPIIALTANAMKGDKEQCLQSGFDAYVTKPIRWPQLASAIEGLSRDRPRVDTAGQGPSPPPSILDEAASLERLGGDVDLLKEIATIFIGDCPRMVDQIADAVARGDAGALKLAAHTLRGSASNFASPAVEDAASRLEKMGSLGDVVGAPEAFAELLPLVDRLASALGQLVAAGGGSPIFPSL